MPSSNPIIRMLKRNTTEVKRIGAVAAESRLLTLTNRTGGTLDHGDIVVLDTTNDESVVLAGGYARNNPLVVVVGNINGELVKCAYPGYGTINITCHGGSLSPGEPIGTSRTPKQGYPLIYPTASNILGITLVAKPFGVRSIPILLTGGSSLGSVAAVPGGVYSTGSFVGFPDRIAGDYVYTIQEDFCHVSYDYFNIVGTLVLVGRLVIL